MTRLTALCREFGTKSKSTGQRQAQLCIALLLLYKLNVSDIYLYADCTHCSAAAGLTRHSGLCALSELNNTHPPCYTGAYHTCTQAMQVFPR